MDPTFVFCFLGGRGTTSSSGVRENVFFYIWGMNWWHQTVFLIFLFIAQFTLYAQIGPMVNAIMW